MRISTLLLLLAITSVGTAQNCHHSCTACITDTYTHCVACPSSAGKLTLVSTAVNGTQYGLCSAPAYSSANGLGLFLLLAGIAAGLFLKSQHIFYFLLSFQVLGLLSLVEVAYPSPLLTILDGLQYFMVFSKMQAANKPKDSTLISRNMYRLDSFLKTADLETNLTPIFVVTVLAAIAFGLVLAVRKLRGGRWQCLNDSVLDSILTGLRTVVLFTMQETMLMIYVGIRLDALQAN